jgi:hypothetical protein
MLDMNLPEVVSEVEDHFKRYESALMAHDVPTLNGFFWDSPHTLRFGIAENLYGVEAIRRFRGAGAPPSGRFLKNTRYTAVGTDTVIVNTEFHRENWAMCGRQPQVWARLPEGWRIVSAHVSIANIAPAQASS